MKFRDFQQSIQNLPVFNLNDARKIDPGFHRQQLNDWIHRGFIQSLAGGYYAFADVHVDENFLFMLANRIYEPSYISQESALAYYLIIPETVLGVTSVTSRKTRQIESQCGRFHYTSIKPELMFGYHILKPEKLVQFKIACLEKAVLDYLYWNKSIASIDDYDGLRWNRQELTDRLSIVKLMEYLQIFGNKTLEYRVDLLMEYIHA